MNLFIRAFTESGLFASLLVPIQEKFAKALDNAVGDFDWSAFSIETLNNPNSEET